MDIKIFLLKLNKDLLIISGIITVIIYSLEALQAGFVSFYVNPIWFLFIFLFSGIVWLFDREKS